MAIQDSPSLLSRTGRSPGLKLLVIVALTIAMAVPLFFVQMVLNERQSTAAGAATDIAQGYGGPQIVAGPILLLPYTLQSSEFVDGKLVQTTQHYTAFVLPDNLNFKVRADTETRSRGIFPVPVYRAGVDLQASFAKAAMAQAVPEGAHVVWKDVSLTVLVSDARGLVDNVVLSVNGRNVPFEPGTDLPPASYAGTNTVRHVSGMQAKLDLSEATDLHLATRFTLRGSRQFSLAPLGRRTVATIDSPWSSPSFFGSFLPSDRHVGKGGFRASWTVPYLARGFGQDFTSKSDAMRAVLSQAFGARFYQPVDHYQLVQRALKYAILFVALAFLVFFVVEIVSQQAMHAVQYAMVGAAQVLFYLEPIQEDWIHAQADDLVNRRSMILIMARRTKAATVDA